MIPQEFDMATKTIIRNISRECYARNGNSHNPTVLYRYDCGQCDHSTIAAAKQCIQQEFGDVRCIVVNSAKVEELKTFYPHGTWPASEDPNEIRVTVLKASGTVRGTGWYWLIEGELDGRTITNAGGQDWYKSERAAREAAQQAAKTIRWDEKLGWVI